MTATNVEEKVPGYDREIGSGSALWGQAESGVELGVALAVVVEERAVTA